MNKKVLITGVYGFIGRYIALEYKKNGYYVIGMGHGNWDENKCKRWGVDECYFGDITLDNLIQNRLEADIIIHCAGGASVGESLRNPMLDFERTVCSLQHILEYIRIYSPASKLIYPSSAAVYGNITDMPLKENNLLKPISPYGVHKKIAEELCSLYCRQYSVSAIIVRLFSVYGNGLRKQLLYDACRKIRSGNSVFWGTGQETRDWIHVKDVAKLFYMARTRANKNCLIANFGSGIGIQIKDILHCLFAFFHNSLLPSFNGKNNAGNPQHYLANIEEIKRWGWKKSVSLEDGIREYVRWYLKNEKN